jgi:hypothetical protein
MSAHPSMLLTGNGKKETVLLYLWLFYSFKRTNTQNMHKTQFHKQAETRNFKTQLYGRVHAVSHSLHHSHGFRSAVEQTKSLPYC